MIADEDHGGDTTDAYVDRPDAWRGVAIGAALWSLVWVFILGGAAIANLLNEGPSGELLLTLIWLPLGPAFALLLVHAARNVEYRIDERELRLRVWKTMEARIPLVAVHGARRRRSWRDGLLTTTFTARARHISFVRATVVIQSDQGPFLISPTDPDAFIAELRCRLEALR